MTDGVYEYPAEVRRHPYASQRTVEELAKTMADWQAAMDTRVAATEERLIDVSENLGPNLDRWAKEVMASLDAWSASVIHELTSQLEATSARLAAVEAMVQEMSEHDG